jgi:hypothetical protein
MKKILFASVLLVVAVALWMTLSKSTPPGGKPTMGVSNAVSQATARQSQTPAETSPAAPPKLGPRPAVLDNPLFKALRDAYAANNREAMERAYEALVEYIKTHPEQIDDFLAALRAESNEHVLRAIARAIAESEALFGDKLAQTAIELAKDTSFQQRQHIMLHLMAQFPEVRDDLHQAVLELSRSDPDSQVKTSAVVVLADWMEKSPDSVMKLLDDVTQILNSAKDDDVRAFAYQVMALHKEKLPREVHSALNERLKAETDSFTGNILASALVAAPEDIRRDALAHVRASFGKETDEETRRNLLVQIVCLARTECLSLLKEQAVGSSLLAEDARDYLALFSTGESPDPDTVLMNKATRDTQRTASKDPHKD